MLTVLTSEFTHFNLVIRLSNVQQLALLFCTFFENSRGSGRPRDPSDLFLSQREIARNNQKLLFLPLQQLLQHHRIMSRHLNQAGTRLAGVVFFPFGSLVR